jgi:hypothetical protein
MEGEVIAGVVFQIEVESDVRDARIVEISKRAVDDGVVRAPKIDAERKVRPSIYMRGSSCFGMGISAR